MASGEGELKLPLPVLSTPYPHIYGFNFFPNFDEIIDNLPSIDQMRQIGEVRGGGKLKRYKERFAFLVGDGAALQKLPESQRRFWGRFSQNLCDGRLARHAMDAFGVQRGGRTFRNDVYLVRDTSDYSLGPHTDTPKKVITLIFYLKGDYHLGTSVYAPKDPTFTDDTGEHFDSGGFDLVKTIPYIPNGVFGFARTNNSFHGVEPVKGERWNLLYDVHAI